MSDSTNTHRRERKPASGDPLDNAFTPGPEQTTQINAAIRLRLREKFSDYEAYALSPQESCILNILFDLMQEFQRMDYLAQLPVLLLDMALGLKSEFYCRVGKDDFALRTPPILGDGWVPPPASGVKDNIIMPQRVCVPVRGRFASGGQEEPDRKVRGLLVLYPESPLSLHQLLFMEKFANRLGFAMHNHGLAQKNSEHLDFVRNLVRDIGHNVLGPNMYFKLLISKLGAGLIELGQELSDPRTDVYSVLEKAKSTHLELLDQLNEIQQNFSHSSLFLESLLRESHFTQGRYVLRTTRLHLFDRVVKAQYQSYLPLFKAKGIETKISCDADVCDEVEADFGLISQVAANIFSNALKYATAMPEAPVPFIRCRVSRQADFQEKSGEKGRVDGVRVEVTTSGERISREEAEHLFEKYFRASNTSGISGTGKGLHFVQVIVLQHQGEAGYQATPEGNLFYFILPCAPEKD